tara:strand:- start:117760 stop:118221 length:462 start_codon:yes stop_codon:yes gene_type:complete
MKETVERLMSYAGMKSDTLVFMSDILAAIQVNATKEEILESNQVVKEVILDGLKQDKVFFTDVLSIVKDLSNDRELDIETLTLMSATTEDQVIHGSDVNTVALIYDEESGDSIKMSFELKHGDCLESPAALSDYIITLFNLDVHSDLKAVSSQ